MKKNSALQYGIIVSVGVAFDYAVYSLLYVVFGVGLAVANTIAFTFGAMVNVYLLRIFFIKTPKFRFLYDFLITLTSNSVVYFVGLYLLLLMVADFGIYHYWAKTLTLVFTFTLNYTIRVMFLTKGKLQ